MKDLDRSKRVNSGKRERERERREGEGKGWLKRETQRASHEGGEDGEPGGATRCGGGFECARRESSLPRTGSYE